MIRYEDAFEILATRGTPEGAAALLARLERELSEPAATVVPQRRGLPGFAVAAIAFLLVLALGVVWALLRPGGSGDVVDDPGVEWIELDSGAVLPESVSAGPGGLIRWPRFVRPGDPGLRFSADGQDWVESSLPEDPESGFIRTVTSSTDRWLVLVEARDNTLRGWTSSDGVRWTTVVWPGTLGETLDEVVGSAGGFLAVSRDPFGSGTSLWWSSDGADWSQLDGTGPTDVNTANLQGTRGGVVWVPFEVRGPSQPVFHSVDGSEWVEGLIELPPDLATSDAELSLEVIEHLSDRWIAIGEVRSAAANPVLQAWTSPDGVSWVPQAVPDFGVVEDRAVAVSAAAIIGDRLVVAPSTVPLGVYEDGTIGGIGEVTSTGELWSTGDGVQWSRVVRSDAEIESIAGTVSSDGTTVGVWLRRPESQQSDEPVVVTTAPPVEPQELDPAGFDLQDEILADGAVTLEEFQQALEGWKRCMEERGITHVSFEIDRQGGHSRGYGSPTPTAGEAEDAACAASYLNRVEAAVGQ